CRCRNRATTRARAGSRCGADSWPAPPCRRPQGQFMGPLAPWPNTGKRVVGGGAAAPGCSLKLQRGRTGSGRGPADALQLGVLGEAEAAAFGAEPGLLEAAEGRERGAARAVDRHAAYAQLLGQGATALEIAREDPCGQAVARLIGDPDRLGL